MQKNEELNEVTINCALKEGLITATEARQMLMVYVSKPKSNPVPYQLIPNQAFSKISRL